MGSGASVEEKEAPGEAYVFNRIQKEWYVHKIREKYESGASPEEVVEFAKSLPRPPRYISRGESQLLSVTILHRHGSRGPGASELKPWSEDKDNGIVSQWRQEDIENLTFFGSLELKSLGRFFSERYLMTDDDDANARELPVREELVKHFVDAKLDRDVFSRNNQGRSIWRCSRSHRVLESGKDLNTSLCTSYNHSAQEAPVKDILPLVPDRYEDVESEKRIDDHGVDHYFRPWNVFKKEMSSVKSNIISSRAWVAKSNNNIGFLTDLYSRLGVDKGILSSGPKMLWCCTYILCLYECERFWPTFEKASAEHGAAGPLPDAQESGDGGEGGMESNIAAAVAKKKAMTRRALKNVLNEMEEDYSESEALRRNLLEDEAVCRNLNVSSPTKTGSSSSSHSGDIGEAKAPPASVDDKGEDERPVLTRLQELALWGWEQRFITSPYTTELGGRLAFDMLKTALNHDKTGLNLYSGHDYSILGVLGVLELLPDGKIPRNVGFGGYLIFEVWSDTPPAHPEQLHADFEAQEEMEGDMEKQENEEKGEEEAAPHLQRSVADREAREKQAEDDPKDRRVLRFLYNDTPFDPQDADICEEYMTAFADSLNPVERDKYEKLWPVLEHHETVLANLSMPRVKRIMGDLLQCCTARNMMVNLEGLDGDPPDVSYLF